MPRAHAAMRSSQRLLGTSQVARGSDCGGPCVALEDARRATSETPKQCTRSPRPSPLRAALAQVARHAATVAIRCWKRITRHGRCVNLTANQRYMNTSTMIVQCFSMLSDCLVSNLYACNTLDATVEIINLIVGFVNPIAVGRPEFAFGSQHNQALGLLS